MAALGGEGKWTRYEEGEIIVYRIIGRWGRKVEVCDDTLTGSTGW